MLPFVPSLTRLLHLDHQLFVRDAGQHGRDSVPLMDVKFLALPNYDKRLPGCCLLLEVLKSPKPRLALYSQIYNSVAEIWVGRVHSGVSYYMLQ
jgi:hypothetical protein